MWLGFSFFLIVGLFSDFLLYVFQTGLASQHGSVASMSSGGGGTGGTASYYQQAPAPPQHGDQQSHPQHSPTKYPENGHDTLSDFVHFVCQEAETQETQVCGVTSVSSMMSAC